jgi:Tfp pilus assembly protein PilZ
VVLCPDEKITEYKPYLSKGVSALFPLSAPPANLETALGAILQVAPRVETRIMVRLSAKVHQMASKHLCQVTNISRSGMFVATNLNLPSGCEVTFELLLPGQPMTVTGEARVARQTLGAGNRTNGLGLSFVSFKMDGRARLDAFLHSTDGVKR